MGMPRGELIEAFSLPRGLSFQFGLPPWAKERNRKQEEKGCLLLSTAPFLPTEKQNKSTKHHPLGFNVLGKLQARAAAGTAAEAGLAQYVFIKVSQCCFTPEILMC